MNFYTSTRKTYSTNSARTLPRTVRFSNLSKTRVRNITKRSVFADFVNLFKNQNSLFFQVFGVIILTSAVFIAAQGILGGTTLNAKASSETRLLTNFQSVNTSQEIQTNSKVQEVFIAQEPVVETKPVETPKTQNVSSVKSTTTSTTKINKN